MVEETIQKVIILLQQQNFEQAEKELSSALGVYSDDVQLLGLMSEVKLKLEKLDEALMLIDSAIGLDPENAYLFTIKARIYIQKKQYAEAEKNLKQSLEIDPFSADCYSFLAIIKLNRKKYQEALELADKALEIDPENILGLNTRSNALIKLNKKKDAFQTIEGALREDPNNSYTHANYGWGLLEKGEVKKALIHFSEALKHDPGNEYAQAGLIEALKARYFIYKLFLKYSFWIGNLTSKFQWMFFIGFYLSVRLLRGIAAANESLAPFLTPLIFLLAIIAFSTWVITPISNAFLRFNKFGKHLLTRHEKISSNLVGISFLVFVMGTIAYIFSTHIAFISVAFVGFTMMIPSNLFFRATKVNNVLKIFTISLAVLGLCSIITAFVYNNVFNIFSIIYFVGFFIFQWVANYYSIKENNQ